VACVDRDEPAEAICRGLLAGNASRPRFVGRGTGGQLALHQIPSLRRHTGATSTGLYARSAARPDHGARDASGLCSSKARSETMAPKPFSH